MTTIDFDYIIKGCNAIIGNMQAGEKILAEEIILLQMELNSGIVMSREDRLKKEKSLYETIRDRNNLVADLSISQKVLQQYIDRKTKWDKHINSAFAEAVNGGFEKVLSAAMDSKDEYVLKCAKEFDAIVNDKTLNKEQKALQYIQFKELVLNIKK